GFTLIELLVSLAILSLVAGVLLEGVAMVRNATSRMQRSHQANQEVIAAQFILRDRIEHIQTVTRADRADPIVDLEGRGHVLTFYASAFPRQGPADFQAFRLLRMATGDLVLFSISSLTENANIASGSLVGWTPTRLLAGVSDLSMSYLGPSPTTPDRNVWQTY